LHAVFRLHQKQLVDFRIGRMHSPPFGPYKNIKGLPKTRWIRWLGTCDQQVEYFKPKELPDWLDAETYAALPSSLVLRELRYRIEQPGCRTREVILVTTLVDPQLYPAEELASLYGQRWQVETDLRHLKQTLRMDVLRTKTVNCLPSPFKFSRHGQSGAELSELLPHLASERLQRDARLRRR